MNDKENKMYSNLADLLNKTLKNGKIPEEFSAKEEISHKEKEKNINENTKNVNKNEEQKKKSFKIKIKKNKNQEKHYTILHKHTENIHFSLNIQNALITLDIAYPFSKNQLHKQYRKLSKILHPDKSIQKIKEITIQQSNNVYKTIQISFNDITNAYKTLLNYFFGEK